MGQAMQEGYVGLDDVIEDANANTMIENEDHVEIDGMGTTVMLKYASSLLSLHIG